MNKYLIRVKYVDGSISEHRVDSYASEWFVLESCLAHIESKTITSFTIRNDRTILC